MAEEGTGRADFFRALLRGVVSVKQEVEETLREEIDRLHEAGDAEEAPPAARPSRRPADEEELARLAVEEGLGRLQDEVVRLARRSLRLSRAGQERAEPGASRLGGAPDLPPGVEWPRRYERPLSFIGQLDLAEAHAVEPALPLPPAGLLSFFWAAADLPSGLHPAHADVARVLHLPAGSQLAAAAGPGSGVALTTYPLDLTRELTIPREYSPWLEPLGLASEEDVAWGRLRERLEALQLDLGEEEWRPAEPVHRVLGWPDDVYGEPERDAALAAAGLNVEDGTAWEDDRAEAVLARAREWRVLLQVSAERDLGAPWGSEWSPARLFFLLHEDDLRAERFDRVRAVLQGA